MRWNPGFRPASSSRLSRTWRLISVGTAIAAGLTLCQASFAQSYPRKPVRWIIPTPPGGGADTLSRVLSQKLVERWGQAVVIDNRGGGGGIIGIEAAARSAPDGYTILMGVVNFTINAALRDRLPYDPIRDFIPVTHLANQPFLLLVHPSVPAKSLREFIALAKSRPGQLNYASTGNGGGQHLCMELLKRMTGINVVHVPYKGSAPGIADLISGQVQATFTSILSAGGHIKSGKLRALAVTTARRSKVFPELPTISEAGVPGYEFTSWFGVLAPAGVPGGITTFLNEEFVKVLAFPEIRQHVAAQGADVVGSSSEEFSNRIRSEIPKWKKLIQDANIRAD